MNYDEIDCKICGKITKGFLGNHLKFKHKITANIYKNIFKTATVSKKMSHIMSKRLSYYNKKFGIGKKGAIAMHKKHPEIVLQTTKNLIKWIENNKEKFSKMCSKNAKKNIEMRKNRGTYFNEMKKGYGKAVIVRKARGTYFKEISNGIKKWNEYMKINKPTEYYKMKRDSAKKGHITLKSDTNKYNKWKEKIRIAEKKRFSNKENRILVSEACKATWRKMDKDYKNMLLLKMIAGRIKRPTSFEFKLQKIIEKNSLPYKYVGDGSFLIGFKNPDFININGSKIAVEVFHEYYKIRGYGSIENYINKRNKLFSKYGWKTIFIDGHELENEDLVVKKLRDETVERCSDE